MTTPAGTPRADGSKNDSLLGFFHTGFGLAVAVITVLAAGIGIGKWLDSGSSENQSAAPATLPTSATPSPGTLAPSSAEAATPSTTTPVEATSTSSPATTQAATTAPPATGAPTTVESTLPPVTEPPTTPAPTEPPPPTTTAIAILPDPCALIDLDIYSKLGGLIDNTGTPRPGDNNSKIRECLMYWGSPTLTVVATGSPEAAQYPTHPNDYLPSSDQRYYELLGDEGKYISTYADLRGVRLHMAVHVGGAADRPEALAVARTFFVAALDRLIAV